MNKFDPAFLQRVEVIRFYPVNEDELRKLAARIIQAENVEISEGQINQIISQADGSPIVLINDLLSFSMNHRVPDRSSISDPEIPSENFSI